MLQKLSFVKDMQFDLCCCQLSRRTKALLVGISDLMLGLAGVTAVGMAVLLHYMEPNPYNWSAQWGRYDHPIYLPGFVMLIGIFTVAAVLYRNDCCAIIATILRLIWVFAWIGMTLIIFFAFVYYENFKKADLESLMLIIVPSIYAITQVYFILILLNFRSKELTMSEESPLSYELSPLSSTQPDEDNHV